MRSGTSGTSAAKNAPRELHGAGVQRSQHQRFSPQALDLPMGRESRYFEIRHRWKEMVNDGPMF